MCTATSLQNWKIPARFQWINCLDVHGFHYLAHRDLSWHLTIYNVQLVIDNILVLEHNQQITQCIKFTLSLTEHAQAQIIKMVFCSLIIMGTSQNHLILVSFHKASFLMYFPDISNWNSIPMVHFSTQAPCKTE